MSLGDICRTVTVTTFAWRGVAQPINAPQRLRKVPLGKLGDNGRGLPLAPAAPARLNYVAENCHAAPPILTSCQCFRLKRTRSHSFSDEASAWSRKSHNHQPQTVTRPPSSLSVSPTRPPQHGLRLAPVVILCWECLKHILFSSPWFSREATSPGFAPIKLPHRLAGSLRCHTSVVTMKANTVASAVTAALLAGNAQADENAEGASSVSVQLPTFTVSPRALQHPQPRPLPVLAGGLLVRDWPCLCPLPSRTRTMINC